MNILMCRPDYFDIEYEINPWMHTSVKVQHSVAMEQWVTLKETYEKFGASVTLVDQIEGLPDMVFTANAGLVWNNRAVVSKFQHKERQGEEPYWRRAFEGLGMETFDTPGTKPFEGAGDGLFVGSTLFIGYGPRSDRETHTAIADILGVEHVSLELVDPRFYHLDTCFSPLGPDAAMYLPCAFTKDGIEEIRKHVAHAIPVPQEVGDAFSCNALVVGDAIVATSALEGIADELKEAGLHHIPMEMSEFLKSGGAVRCLSLPLDTGMSQ
ncbi:MAG: dimethylarginine dimethylaminohydrolase family protein [Candidatus Dormibacteria bacterium]